MSLEEMINKCEKKCKYCSLNHMWNQKKPLKYIRNWVMEKQQEALSQDTVYGEQLWLLSMQYEVYTQWNCSESYRMCRF